MGHGMGEGEEKGKVLETAQSGFLVSPEQLRQYIHVTTVTWIGWSCACHPLWPQSPPLPIAHPPPTFLVPAAIYHWTHAVV